MSIFLLENTVNQMLFSFSFLTFLLYSLFTTSLPNVQHRLLLEPSRRPKWAWLLFAPPFSLNTPLCVFLLIPFRNIKKLYGLHNDAHFLSRMLRNFMDYAMMLFLTSRMLQNFTDCATMLVFDFWNVAELYGLHNNACFFLPECCETLQIT